MKRETIKHFPIPLKDSLVTSRFINESTYTKKKNARLIHYPNVGMSLLGHLIGQFSQSLPSFWVVLCNPAVGLLAGSFSSDKIGKCELVLNRQLLLHHK